MTRCSCSSHGSFLTAKGLEEAAQRELKLNELDDAAVKHYLDRVGSVSASVEVEEATWVDAILEEQHRRFLNAFHQA